MQKAREIPDTPRGSAYRRIAWVVGIGSAVTIADQFRALFWHFVAGVPEGSGAMYIARHGLLLAGGVLLCWLAVLAIRRNTVPPTWALLAIPVLIWTVALLPVTG